MTEDLGTTTGYEADPRGVAHPAHYNLHPSGIECIELIRGLNFSIGSAVKYVMRRGLKGDIRKDLDKALWYLGDYLFDEDDERRTEKPPFGEMKHRYQWDAVTAADPDPLAREFYLAVARQDVNAARYAAEKLVAELDQAEAQAVPENAEVTVDHEFESVEGSSGRACTRLVDRDGDGEDCGLPPEVHYRG